jgi:bifunctional DNA-binding transcriptional regulator/antitoxin component of YhaV-PrlF toxin-antitoxin module
MSTIVGTKGQVTIEKELREQLGVEPGWRAIQRLEGDKVTIEFRPPKHSRSLAGILAGKATRVFPTSEDLEQAIEEAWAGAATEAVKVGNG